MALIVKSLPSYIKDSHYALEIFRDFNFLREDKLIFTMEISSLYTVIPNSEGLLVLKYFFDRRTVKEPSKETLLRLAELVLALNCFSFAGNYFKQVNDVATGTKMGPSYANLFIGYVEHQVFNQYEGRKPDFYGRYIDDCNGAISSSKEELNGYRFITSVSFFRPALKYTWEISETSRAFLDIKVSINGNGLYYVLVCTTNPQILTVICYIHHPTHPMSKIPFPILNFLDSDVCAVMTLIFLTNLKKCASFFEKRGYPASVIQTAHHRSQQTDRQSALQTSHKEKLWQSRIPFTLTFHPHNNPVKVIVLNNIKILQNDPETGTIFSQPPLISYKRDKNVGNFLVKSTFKTIEKPGAYE